MSRFWLKGGSTAAKSKVSNAGKLESIIKTGDISSYLSCSRTRDVMFRNTEERSVADGREITPSCMRIVRASMLQKVGSERWLIRLSDKGMDFASRPDPTT